jgi:hypothetical protein
MMPKKLPLPDHPDRPVVPRKKRAYKWKAKVGKPALKEWEDVSRKVFNKLNELLDAVDDDGKSLCTPALLTAASRLIIESETLFKKPENVETDKLHKQLESKRLKRAARPQLQEVFAPNSDSLGYSDLPGDDPNTQLRGAKLRMNPGETE